MLFCSSLKIYFVSPLDPCLEISTGGPCFCLPVEIEVIFSCGDQSWKLTFRDESDATVCGIQKGHMNLLSAPTKKTRRFWKSFFVAVLLAHN
jgi:hypothetical protein